MNDLPFDAITRRAAVVALSATGVAVLAPPLAAGARNRKKKGKRSAVYTRCQKQVGQCLAIFIPQCNGDPACLASLERCCATLATCDWDGLFICFGGPQTS